MTQKEAHWSLLWTKDSNKEELFPRIPLGGCVVGAYLPISPCGPGTQRVEWVMAGHRLQKLGLHLSLPGPLHAMG